MIIYAITNKLSGKRYIGMTTVLLSKRWYQHCQSANRGKSGALYSAMRKYGSDAFEVSEIANLVPGMTQVELNELERIIIAQENTVRPNGYNLTIGGDGIPAGHKFPQTGSRKGRPWSEARWAAQNRPKEERRTVQKAEPKPLQRYWTTAEERFAIRSASMKRAWAEKRECFKPMSAETKAKVAAANRRKNSTDEHKAKMREAWANNPARQAAAAERMRRMNHERVFANGRS